MTITRSLSGTFIGRALHMPSYVTIVSNDTTGTVSGPVIDNRDGMIEAIFATENVTNKTGTSPTATLKLFGSNLGSVGSFYQLTNSTGGSIASTALTLTGATVSGSAVTSINTTKSLTNLFPAFLKLIDTRGGSASPGVTATISVLVIRRQPSKGQL